MTASETADFLAKKAESIISSGKNHQAIIQEVMMIGGKAMLSKSFTLAQAEYVAASMIAAISMIRSADNAKNPS